MARPEVSVLMSVYNGDQHLAESVESILDQSLTNFEFVIIDDGSTDSAPRILEKYASRDKRIRLLSNESNIGLTRSLNRGLKEARGEYVARHDADDISLPDRLSREARFLDQNPGVGLVGTAYQRIDDRGRRLGQTYVSPEHDVLKASLLMMNPLCHGSVLARRDLLLDLGGYDERLRYAQDYDLWWRVSQVSSLATLPEILVARRYGESISTLRREDQSECVFQVSLRAIQESLRAGTLDQAAFTRFWWTQRGRYDQMRRGDPRRLRELWDLLSTCPAGPKVWGPRIRALSLGLIGRRRVVEGLQLLWTGTRHLGVRDSWRRSPQTHSANPVHG